MKARVTTFNDEKVIININHCKTCEKYFMNIEDATPIMADVLSYFTESELIETRKMIDTILHDEYEN